MSEVERSLWSGWYGVRCLFSGTDDVGQPCFEERVTIWKAKSFAQAIELAEAEAEEYAAVLEDGSAYVGLAQAYAMADKPSQGAEVFSLIRDSDLSPEEYLARFFSTGDERQDTVD